MCNMCHFCLFAYYIVCRGSSINYVRTCLTHPSPMSALFIPVCCHFFLNVLPIIPKKCWRTLWTSPSTTPACCCSWGHSYMMSSDFPDLYTPFLFNVINTFLLLCHKFPSIFDLSLSKMATSFMESPLHE